MNRVVKGSLIGGLALVLGLAGLYYLFKLSVSILIFILMAAVKGDLCQ